VKIKITLALLLALVTINASAANGAYTCGDLRNDNKNHTVLGGNNPTFRTVDEFLNFAKKMIFKNFPADLSEKYFFQEKSEGKSDKEAFRSAIGIFSLQKENIVFADRMINASAKEAGGLDKYITEFCDSGHFGDDRTIDEVFRAFIISSNTARQKFPDQF